jgi:hypothetical protein
VECLWATMSERLLVLRSAIQSGYLWDATSACQLGYLVYLSEHRLE